MPAYPDLTLDLRAVLHLEETAAKDCDLLLLHGWFEAGGWVALRTARDGAGHCSHAGLLEATGLLRHRATSPTTTA